MFGFGLPKMFFTPSELLKEFIVETKVPDVNERGREVASWQETEPQTKVTGIIGQLSQQEKEKYRQMQVEITHTILSKGTPQAKNGDRFVFEDNRYLYIHKVENAAEIGLWTVYQCEEKIT